MIQQHCRGELCGSPAESVVGVAPSLPDATQGRYGALIGNAVEGATRCPPLSALQHSSTTFRDYFYGDALANFWYGVPGAQDPRGKWGYAVVSWLESTWDLVTRLIFMLLVIAMIVYIGMRIYARFLRRKKVKKTC